MLLGEQPGDREDLEGAPFVGPSGTLLRRVLADVHLDARDLYVTNAVKHFKWEPSGRTRLHKTPSAREVEACRPWLDAEIKAVRPAVVLCLGATAARALLGSTFRVTQHRGEVFDGPHGSHLTATVHPSSLLRITDSAERAAELDRFTQDVKAAATLAASRTSRDAR